MIRKVGYKVDLEGWKNWLMLLRLMGHIGVAEMEWMGMDGRDDIEPALTFFFAHPWCWWGWDVRFGRWRRRSDGFGRWTWEFLWRTSLNRLVMCDCRPRLYVMMAVFFHPPYMGWGWWFLFHLRRMLVTPPPGFTSHSSSASSFRRKYTRPQKKFMVKESSMRSLMIVGEFMKRWWCGWYDCFRQSFPSPFRGFTDLCLLFRAYSSDTHGIISCIASSMIFCIKCWLEEWIRITIGSRDAKIL